MGAGVTGIVEAPFRHSGAVIDRATRPALSPCRAAVVSGLKLSHLFSLMGSGERRGPPNGCRIGGQAGRSRSQHAAPGNLVIYYHPSKTP
jgi:hypothetical protein